MKRTVWLMRGALLGAEPEHGSWDLNLADGRDGGALGDVERQQLECAFLAVGVDCPPDLVAAGAARCQGRPVAKRALVAFEGGEHHAAVVGGVTVVKQVTRHAPSLPWNGSPYIRALP